MPRGCPEFGGKYAEQDEGGADEGSGAEALMEEDEGGEPGEDWLQGEDEGGVGGGEMLLGPALDGEGGGCG